MSVKCLTAVFYEVQNCSPAEKMVLLAIADHARDSGQAWPGIDLIAKKASVTHRAVTDILIRLEEKGQLIIDRNWGPKGVNCYSLVCVSKGKYDPPTRQEMVDEGEERASLHRNAVPTPAPSSYPPKTLGNEAPPRNAVPTQERSSLGTADAPSSYKPLGTTEIKKKGASGPSLGEVLKAAAEYPGNAGLNLAPGIPELWATGHFEIRALHAGYWSANWHDAMYALYEKIHREKLAPAVAAPRAPVARQWWQVEKELEAVKTQLREHKLCTWSANVPVPPAVKQHFDNLCFKRLELQKELDGTHD